MAECKRRGRKTNQMQMEMIVNFIKNNKIFSTGKCNPSHPNELEEKWEQLAEELNQEAGGANKTVKQWRTFVSEWKSRVRKKARTFHKNLTRTGGGGYFHRDLSELENKLMGAIGWLAITGNEELPQELDPEEISISDLKQTQRTEQFVPEQLVTDEIAAEQFAAEEEAIAEAEEMHLPQNVSVRERIPTRRSKQRRYTSNKTQLQKSAELYSNSANALNESIAQLSVGISSLASAMNNLADAIRLKASLNEF